ncbi:MAG TPA: 4-alpha-glucanotransferase [Candidatus Sulfotelmatobacter sp.]|nr:4-alpha-glucanotransferase [Candidatus Sulfotelmatobacter sp.]
MQERGAGILLHPTSLPGPYGIGDLGPSAFAFADFLAGCRQKYWQALPLNPTSPAYGNSPYSSISAFAGSPSLISPDRLVEEHWLPTSALRGRPPLPEGRTDYAAAMAFKAPLLEQAYRLFRTDDDHAEFDGFCATQASWLEDFALFVVIKRRQRGTCWNRWPADLRDREPAALRTIQAECRDELDRERFLQYLVAMQWGRLKQYCNSRGIRLIGDLSIYVNLDSADVWAHPELFKLNDDKTPQFVSGVPPDHFSKTGQLWGNPVYRWDRLQETGFQWWIQRLEHNVQLFDALRVDHFRGLVAYWEVPAAETIAVNGRWVKVPSEAFFAALLARFPGFPVLAEDLGYITPDVRATLDRLGLPGMKVLLFAFSADEPNHPYLPHVYPRNCIVYTGTHDNNTSRGWFEKEASPEDRKRLFSYLGRDVPVEEISWAFVRLAMLSVADTAIIPMQDLLGLGDEARMNRPGNSQGNWEWRFAPDRLTPALDARLRELTRISGRA